MSHFAFRPMIIAYSHFCSCTATEFPNIFVFDLATASIFSYSIEKSCIWRIQHLEGGGGHHFHVTAKKLDHIVETNLAI